MTIEVRPSRREDLLQLVDRAEMPNRFQGVTLLEDGRPLAMGGLVFRPDDTVWIGALISDRARRARVSLHKAGMAVMRLARELELRELFALPDPTVARSEAWLERHGFRPTAAIERGRRVWIWTA